MTDKQIEQRKYALSRSGGACAICGKSILYGHGQYAHKIAQTQMNRKKYGSFFIDHTLNGEYVCSLECNSTVAVSKPREILSVLADIIIYEIKRLDGNTTEL